MQLTQNLLGHKWLGPNVTWRDTANRKLTYLGHDIKSLVSGQIIWRDT